MAKITLPTIASGYASITQLNSAFDSIEQEFNNKVLYRDNPTGEANQMEVSIDMNSNSITNVNGISTETITVDGIDLTAQITASQASSAAAAASATAAANSASSAAASASTIGTSVSDAATSETNAANSASAASTSASNASTSASAASTSATNASSSASSASTSASTATTQATNASSSATAASSAQTAAESARDATLAAFDSFDDRYLGAKSSNPTLDNDGNALLAGALYYNTTAPEMRVYTGSVWVAAYVSGTGFLATSANLSDLTNAATARDNLGVEIGVDVQAYDADIPTVSASQAEMEAGTEAALRSMSPLRVKQAITANASAAGGVTNTTSATSITLTSASTLTQNVAMTAVDKAVVLPAATTITKLGSDLFTINNTGAYHFYIQLSAGGYINQVAPGSSVTLSLADNTTSDGKWVQSDLGYTAYKMYGYSAFSIPSALVDISIQSGGVLVRLAAIQQFSATSYAIIYLHPNDDSYLVMASVSGTTITYGTPVALAAFANGGIVGILKYSATTGIVLGFSGTTLTARPFSLSGTTITLGTAASLTTQATAMVPNNGETFSSTLAPILTMAGSTLSARSLQYNGASAPTFGTASTINSIGLGNISPSLAIVSSTTACIIYPNTTPYNTNAVIATFSGTSAPSFGTGVSLGTDVTALISNTATKTSIIFKGGTEYLVSCTGRYNWQKNITISGATISSPTASVPIPIINESATGSYETASIPQWMTTSTGLVLATYNTPPSVGNNGNITSLKEAKYISGYGWTTGLTMPRHIAFNTPTGLNQANGINTGNYTNAKWTILDSSTMLVTANVTTFSSPYTSVNPTWVIYSFIIKPTT